MKPVVAVGVALSALALASPSAAAISTSCPKASVVNAALGQKGKGPLTTTTPYSKTCTYPGSGIVPTKITFQKDTAATFAAGEKAASVLGIVKLKGLGQAAWAPKAGGGIYVFEGGETVKILSPLTSIAKLEVLVRKLL